MGACVGLLVVILSTKYDCFKHLVVVYCVDVFAFGPMFCIVVAVTAPSVFLPGDFVLSVGIGLGSNEEFGLIHYFNIIVSDYLEAFELSFANGHSFTSQL